MNWKELFQSPRVEDRPMLFWLLNHRMEREHVTHQIHSFKEKGLRGIVLQAHRGLTPESRSEEGLAWVRFCVEEARKQGLQVWLSEEGTEESELTREYPEYRQQTLAVVKVIEAAPGRVVHLDDINDEISYIVGVTELGDVRKLDSEALENNTLDVPSDIKKLYFFAKRTVLDDFYQYKLDVLNPEAVQALVNMTYERYRVGLGEQAKEIKGFYSTYRQFGNVEANEIPWTDDLPRRFHEQHGHELWEVLPSLISSGEKEKIAHRCHFLQCLTDLYIEAYYKAIKDYCHQQGWHWIGHLAFEGEIRKQAWSLGDVSRVMEETDSLSCGKEKIKASPEQLFTSLLGAKFVISGQRLFDHPQVMSEGFSREKGLGITLQEMNRDAGLQAAIGVNAFIPKAAYYSLEGFRKRHGSSVHSYQQTFWPHYQRFVNSLSRVGSLMRVGEPISRALVLYPTRTIWGMFSLHEENQQPAEVWEQQLNECCVTLLRNQRDFDFIAEEWLARLSVGEKGEITYTSPKEKIKHYQTLILPLCQVLRNETLDQLQRLIVAGAVIHFIETLPDATSETGLDESIRERIQSWIHEDENVHFVSFNDLATMFERVEAGIRLKRENPSLLYQHRLFKEGDLFLLYNVSEKETREKVRFPTSAQYAYEAEMEGGSFHALPVEGPEPEWEVQLAPGQARLFVMTCNPVENAMPAEVEESELIRSQPFDKTYFFFTQDGNELPLCTWNLTVSPKEREQELVYQTTFWVDRYRGYLHLICDGLHHQTIDNGRAAKKFQVILNGFEITQEVDFQPNDDRLLKAYNIQPYVLRGENMLEIRTQARQHEPLAVQHALMLRGEFALVLCERHYVLTTPSMKIHQGSWTTQGYPFYSGTGVYRQEMMIDALGEKQRAFVQFEEVRDLVEVTVNGNEAGVLWKAPWQLDVTEHLCEGKNLFEFHVTNTLVNRFTGENRASGIVGTVILNIVQMK